MISIVLNKLRLRLSSVACGLLLANMPVSQSVAGDDQSANGYPTSNGYRMMRIRQQQKNTGYQGFGLNFHPGFGYGGRAGGVGQDGGYPYYGGIGYPGPMPQLRRRCGINPFPYNGSPGGPTPACPHYYGIPGPLVPTEHVITFDQDPHTPPYYGEYGVFTGAFPYPESTFVPGSNQTMSDSLPSPAEPPVEKKDNVNEKQN